MVAAMLLITGLVPGTEPGDKNSRKKYIQPAPASPAFSSERRHKELAARRKRVAEGMTENSLLILFSAPSKIYTNDVDYAYRQENNLYYLTGLRQNGVTLVISKSGGEVGETLFLPRRNPQFETWNGRMYSNSDATEVSGITNIVDAKQKDAFLEAVVEGTGFSSPAGVLEGGVVIYLLTGNVREFEFENEFASKIDAARIRNASPIFSKLRLIKSPYEIDVMQHAIDITSEALMRSMGMIGRAKYEFEVHAEVDYTFRKRNADYWGYPSIVGCGPNATTLHYIESQGSIGKNDLMLMDVGAEFDHYTADITRTFPVSGKFTKLQAEIYQIVYDAQEAAARELKPGAKFSDASGAAKKVIVEGLFKLGLITDKNSNQYRLWYMHGWGHWLGMNVHDVGNYNVTLAEGMMMTNEPGIYFRENALEFLPDTPEWNEFKSRVGPVFEKYKNIGVRIEDDMLITKGGVEWMSKALPRSIQDVEKFMKGAKKEMDRYAFREKLDPSENQNALAAFHGDETAGDWFETPVGMTRKHGFDSNGKSVFISTH